MALSREWMLGFAGKFDTREVHVPSWAGPDGDDVVIVRSLTPRELELNQDRITRMKASDGKSTAHIIARCVVDSEGGRVFTDADIPLIAEMPLAGITKLGAAIMEASGLTDEAEEDIEGNSESRETVSSSSDSPSISAAPSVSSPVASPLAS